tara:strand:+ start:428 stop:613 length:186 start_codon:yes stop_codon:yes gene_type:complete
MSKYEILIAETRAITYLVEAKSKEDAEKKYWNDEEGVELERDKCVESYINEINEVNNANRR